MKHATIFPRIFVNGLLGSLLIVTATLATAETYLPQKDGKFYLPDDWLLGSGQPYHLRIPASNNGREMVRREPSAGEATALRAIQGQFQALDSKVFLLGDGNEIVHIETKPPAREDSLLLSASMDKSLTAFSAGVAICDNKIALHTKAKDVLPEMSEVALGNSTLRDNLRMASGTTTAFDDSNSFTGQETADMQAGRKSFMDFLKGRLGQARAWTKPGERFDYKSQDPLLAGMMVAAAYGTQGRQFRQWQSDYFFSKVLTNDRRIQGVDRFGYAQSDGNTRMTIGDWARLAAFIGQARKQADCYGSFLREATTTQIRNDGRFAKPYKGYGYFTWTDNSDIPNSYSALGYGGQAIIWSTVNDRYFIVFSNSTTVSDIHKMAKLWLDAGK